MLKKLMFPQDRRVYRLVAATLAVLFVLICAPRCVGQQPTATAVMTDRDALPASSRFGVPNQFKLTGAGEVFFTSGGNTGLFRWSQAAGIERLLQTNDPLKKLSPTLPEGLLDLTGGLLEVNAGYAAFTFSAAIKGSEDPGTPVVYDGSSYRLLNVGVSTFSQLLLNASGRVAVLGSSGYWSPLDAQRIEVETASSSPRGVLVAQQFQPAPASVGGSYNKAPQFIGFNDAGQVAFLAGIGGGNTSRAIFLFDGTEVRLVVKSGTATGDFNLPAAAPMYGVGYALNNNGQVAFQSSTVGGQPAIWIGDSSGVSTKLIGRGDATGVPELGNCATAPILRGFNDSDRVLYDCMTTSELGHALFLKSLADPAPQVVFRRGQSGGSAGTFVTTQQASLNNAGKVAFLATLTGGSSPMGWYLAPGDTDPVKIAIEGEGTPAGGAFGLRGRSTPALINGGGQVVFLADILESDAVGMFSAVGLFSWTNDGGVTTVVSTNDLLPDGANTVLRAGSASASDTETLVRVLKAGGQAAWYAKQLNPGMSGLRKIVAEFDQVPNLGTVVGSDSFSMNGKGEVVFTAALMGAGSIPRSGILASLPGSGLKSVAETGGGAPGGGSLTGFSAPQLNNQTQVAFFANTHDGTTASQGIFIASPEPPSLQKIVRTGDAWPAGTGFSFAGLDSSLSLNDSGQVAFLGTRSAPGRPGLFVGSAAAAPLKVFETSETAPPAIFNGIDTGFKLNAAGQVAFVANYPSVSGVFLGSTASEPQPIARTGSSAPGTGGMTFSGFTSSTLDLNSSGQVAFYASLSPGSGLFLGSATAPLSPRLLQNQPLPGGGQTSFVRGGAGFAALADSGEMAIYLASVTGGAQKPQVVIAGADGTLRKFVIAAEKADNTGSEFAKLYPTLVATPSGKFLFGAVLVNGLAQAGIFINKP